LSLSVTGLQASFEHSFSARNESVSNDVLRKMLKLSRIIRGLKLI
jgi:hypothetical protein